MAYIKYESVSLVATTSGTTSTGSTTVTFNGYLRAVRYVASTSGGGAPSTDGSVTITGARNGVTLLIIADLSTASTNTYYPVATTVTPAGVASTGAAPIPLFDEVIDISISSGSTGGSRTGAYHFWVE